METTSSASLSSYSGDGFVIIGLGDVKPNLMVKILITTLPEATRALHTEIHMTMGWTYQQMWLHFAGGPAAYKAGVCCGGYGQSCSLRLENSWTNMEIWC